MKHVDYLIGSPEIQSLPMPPLDPDVCGFAAELSSALMRDSAAKGFPDVMSLAFWCRKANLEKIRTARKPERNRLGRGLVFHIAPSNVPVNFAFSFLFSLLAGNANIVRVPSEPFPQTKVICDAINRVAENHPAIKGRTAIVSYPADTETTAMFSAMADARMIWGGDATIEAIRMLKTKPRCLDLTFADRYSICILDGDAVLAADDSELARLAQGFYNDTYLSDQNACSSPRLVLWQNGETAAKNRFWRAIADFAGSRYNLPAAIVVDKYTRLCQDAIELNVLYQAVIDGNVLYRVTLSELPDGETDKLRGIGGYFYEYDLQSFDELKRIVNEKYQTITYYGSSAETLREFVLSRGLRGIDRIVPVGAAMDIGVIWDGYDIINMLSRVVCAE